MIIIYIWFGHWSINLQKLIVDFEFRFFRKGYPYLETNQLPPCIHLASIHLSLSKKINDECIKKQDIHRTGISQGHNYNGGNEWCDNISPAEREFLASFIGVFNPYQDHLRSASMNLTDSMITNFHEAKNCMKAVKHVW